MRDRWLLICEILLTMFDMLLPSTVSRLMLAEIQRVRALAGSLHKKPAKPAKRTTTMTLSHQTMTEFKMDDDVILTVGEAPETLRIGDSVKYRYLSTAQAAALAHALLIVLGSRDGIHLCTPGDESPWDQIMRDLRYIAAQPQNQATKPTTPASPW